VSGVHVASGDKIQRNAHCLAGLRCPSLFWIYDQPLALYSKGRFVMMLFLLTGDKRIWKWTVTGILSFQHIISRKGAFVFLLYEFWHQAWQQWRIGDIIAHPMPLVNCWIISTEINFTLYSFMCCFIWLPFRVCHSIAVFFCYFPFSYMFEHLLISSSAWHFNKFVNKSYFLKVYWLSVLHNNFLWRDKHHCSNHTPSIWGTILFQNFISIN
jgi:hypothetical protein